jgi:hypothetical protein
MTSQNDSSQKQLQPQEDLCDLEEANLENVVGGGWFSKFTGLFSKDKTPPMPTTGATMPVPTTGATMPVPTAKITMPDGSIATNIKDFRVATDSSGKYGAALPK